MLQGPRSLPGRSVVCSVQASSVSGLGIIDFEEVILASSLTSRL